jgi:hypothetical protein
LSPIPFPPSLFRPARGAPTKALNQYLTLSPHACEHDTVSYLVAMKNKIQLAHVLEYTVQGLYKYCTIDRQEQLRLENSETQHAPWIRSRIPRSLSCLSTANTKYSVA